MTLPPSVRMEIEERFGAIDVLGSVGGGCINPAVHARHDGGEIFIKYNAGGPNGFFSAEAEGLRELQSVQADLVVPRVLGVRDPLDGKPGWLVLEWLASGARTISFSDELGRGLAGLHRATQGAWGWHRDGFIGSLPQRNTRMDRWAEFWRLHRLEPQLSQAREAGYFKGDDEQWDALFDRLPALLAAADGDGPSLLHGDLWGGNVLAALIAGAVRPALVDPAVYYGHREVDLAMSELFGGFGEAFYRAYEEVWPLQPGYRPQRRAVYQLFYLLVHVNLFGTAYHAPARAALRRALEP